MAHLEIFFESEIDIARVAKKRFGGKQRAEQEQLEQCHIKFI